MIILSEKAYQKVKQLIEESNYDSTYFLKVEVVGGGCSGLKYNMDFTNQSNEDDQIFEHQDLKVVTNKKSLLYLIGTELDYSDGLNGKGFEWNNPQATRTCGCGESFSL
jgi:iron-sulfur cluster assembly protein